MKSEFTWARRGKVKRQYRIAKARLMRSLYLLERLIVFTFGLGPHQELQFALTHRIQGKVVLIATCTGSVSQMNLVVEKIFYQEPGYKLGQYFEWV